MYRVGLTGGIASGKSTVTHVLRERGVWVIEADVVARALVEPGSPVLEALVSEFGDGILQADGSLDRTGLGRVVFESEAKLALLNEITHPALVTRLIELMEDAEQATGGRGGVLALDAALLAEWDILDLFDVVVVIDAPLDARLQRLVAGGLPEEQARDRIAAQLPADQLRELGDIIIVNDGTLDELRSKADALADRLIAESASTDGDQQSTDSER